MNQSRPRKLCCEGAGGFGVIGSDGRGGSPPRPAASRRCVSTGSVGCLDERTNSWLLQNLYGPDCNGCRLPEAPSTTIGVSSLYSGAAVTCSLVNSSVMLSLLLATRPKCRAFQSTTIFRLPTPRKPPKSMTAARTVPVRSTITSTMRPMFSSVGLRTSRPSTPCASLAPMMVTEGGGAGSFGGAGGVGGGGGGVFWCCG